MRRSCLIGMLGQSPAIVTELVRYLYDYDGCRLTDVTMMITDDEDVKASSKFVKASLLVHYPRCHYHEYVLDFEDVLSEESNLKFMELSAKLIYEARKVHGVERVYLSVAGGRKITGVSLGVLASLFGIQTIFHVIEKDIRRYNEFQERYMSDIKGFGECKSDEELKARYRENQEVYDRIMFPPAEDVVYLRIPVVPFPREELGLIKRMLSGIYLDEEYVSPDKLKAYRDAGIIYYDRRRTYATETGEVWRRILEYVI